MRAGKGAKWVILYRYENRKLVIIHEPIRSFKVHNLLVAGWKQV